MLSGHCRAVLPADLEASQVAASVVRTLQTSAAGKCQCRPASCHYCQETTEQRCLQMSMLDKWLPLLLGDFRVTLPADVHTGRPAAAAVRRQAHLAGLVGVGQPAVRPRGRRQLLRVQAVAPHREGRAPHQAAVRLRLLVALHSRAHSCQQFVSSTVRLQLGVQPCALHTAPAVLCAVRVGSPPLRRRL